MNQAHLVKSQPILRGHQAERVTVLGFHGGVIDQGKTSVRGTAAPDFLAAHHEGIGFLHRGPCLPVIVAAGSAGMLPQPDNTGFI